MNHRIKKIGQRALSTLLQAEEHADAFLRRLWHSARAPQNRKAIGISVIAVVVALCFMLGVQIARDANRLQAEQADTTRSAAVLASSRNMMERVLDRLGSHRRLSEVDAARYAHIFAFQDIGDFKSADAEIAKLNDRRLLGHVLAQRYLHSDYEASYSALADWLRAYNDLPNADKIHALAMRKKPTDYKAPKEPEHLRGVWAQHDFDVGQLAQPYLASRTLSTPERDTLKLIEGHLAERPTAALRLLETAHAKGQFSDTGEFDAVRGDVAESYFYNQKPDRAFALAAASADRSTLDVPKAAWIAGLSAWKVGEPAKAARYFEIAASSKRASVWMTAAAAHWAARSHLRAGNPRQVSVWLAKSAEYPRTFYGLISMKMLGMEQETFSWEMPSFGDVHARELAVSAQGRRALALVDAERPDLAELELGRLNPGNDKSLQEAMIALANEAGMPWIAMRMGSGFRDQSERLYDAALYPDAPWQPAEGFAVDKALVYAFIRQESKFNPYASNTRSGAVGLMQIMPSTAQHIVGMKDAPIQATQLRDPVVNIDLGQKYLAELLNHPGVNNNLFKLAVAYNAGPGKLARWSKQASYEDDPLFFIEAIPAAETRIFVERVLTNYWIYRLKFAQDTGSLDDVAAGNWPTYVVQDIRAGSRFAAALLWAAE